MNQFKRTVKAHVLRTLEQRLDTMTDEQWVNFWLLMKRDHCAVVLTGTVFEHTEKSALVQDALVREKNCGRRNSFIAFK